MTPDGSLTLGDARPVLPRSPQELVRTRLNVALRRQDSELAAVAERLSLLGGAFSFSLAEALARRLGLDAVRLDTGLEVLVRMGVLADEATEAYAFRHELVRAVLLPLSRHPKSPCP